MKRLILLVTIFTLIMSALAYAGDLAQTVSPNNWFCVGYGCGVIKPHQKLEAVPEATIVMPTPGQILALFPNAYVINGEIGYAIKRKDAGAGTGYQVAKVWNLFGLSVDWLALSKGSSLTAGAVNISAVDLLTKINGTAPATGSAITILNPSLGVMYGYATATASYGAGWDGGPKLWVINADLSQIPGWFGL